MLPKSMISKFVQKLEQYQQKNPQILPTAPKQTSSLAVAPGLKSGSNHPLPPPFEIGINDGWEGTKKAVKLGESVGIIDSCRVGSSQDTVTCAISPIRKNTKSMASNSKQPVIQPKFTIYKPKSIPKTIANLLAISQHLSPEIVNLYILELSTTFNIPTPKLLIPFAIEYLLTQFYLTHQLDIQFNDQYKLGVLERMVPEFARIMVISDWGTVEEIGKQAVARFTKAKGSFTPDWLFHALRKYRKDLKEAGVNTIRLLQAGRARKTAQQPFEAKEQLDYSKQPSILALKAKHNYTTIDQYLSARKELKQKIFLYQIATVEDSYEVVDLCQQKQSATSGVIGVDSELQQFDSNSMPDMSSELQRQSSNKSDKIRQKKNDKKKQTSARKSAQTYFPSSKEKKIVKKEGKPNKQMGEQQIVEKINEVVYQFHERNPHFTMPELLAEITKLLNQIKVPSSMHDQLTQAWLSRYSK